MKKFTTLFCSLFFFQLIAQNVEKELYEDGKIKAEGAYTSAKTKIGIWKYYYTNGHLEAEGRYNGKKIGKVIDVIRTRINSVIDDKLSARDGKWIFYYTNGKKKGTVSYESGCPTNLLIKWYKTGEKMEEAAFVDCKPIGNKKTWAKEGWLKYETVNEGNGRSMEVEMYASGKKKSAIPYKNGQQYGRVKRWYENGQKEEDVMMKNTRVHGSYRSWYSNGKKQREFFSINNVMSGEYREWNKDGNLLFEITELTEENKILVKKYWSNGQLKMQGRSAMPSSLSIHEWSQNRQGYWSYWHQDGIEIKIEKYSNGQLLTVEMP